MPKDTIVTVTSKGQATIPKKMREKHKIGRKALVVDTEDGVLFKPIVEPETERGSLRGILKNSTSTELINEGRVRADKNKTKGRA